MSFLRLEGERSISITLKAGGVRCIFLEVVCLLCLALLVCSRFPLLTVLERPSDDLILFMFPKVSVSFVCLFRSHEVVDAEWMSAIKRLDEWKVRLRCVVDVY